MPERNRISSPGLESLGNLPSEKEYHDHIDTGPEVHEHLEKLAGSVRRRKWHVLVFMLACITVGLGVGLGVGLTRDRRLYKLCRLRFLF